MEAVSGQRRATFTTTAASVPTVIRHPTPASVVWKSSPTAPGTGDHDALERITALLKVLTRKLSARPRKNQEPVEPPARRP
jgi:hypothetical protein